MEGRVVVQDNEEDTTATAAAATTTTPAANSITTTTAGAAAAAAATTIGVEDSSEAVRERSIPILDKTRVVDALEGTPGVGVVPLVDSFTATAAGKPAVVGSVPVPQDADPALDLALEEGTPDSSTVETLAAVGELEPRVSDEMPAVVASKEPVGTPEREVTSDGTGVVKQAGEVADREFVLLPQEAGAESPVVPVVDNTPGITAVEGAASTHVSETPSVEKEATIVAEERLAEPKVPAEVAVVPEAHVGTPEHPVTSDDTDVVKQAGEVADREAVLPQEAENPVVPIVDETPGSSAVGEAASTHVPETPSVEKEATVVSEERLAEPKVPSEVAVASEEHVGTLEHPPTSDETDVVKQAEVVVDRETVLPQKAENPVVPIVDKTPGSSAVEEAVSTHEPETPSVEKAVLVEQVQGVPPVEEGTHSAVEEAVSTHVSETPSVEKEAAVVSEETKVPSELAVASEEPVGTPEHPPTSDETDVVKQAEVIFDQETVLPREADAENSVVPIAEKTPSSSAAEEAVSNHESETPSVEKAVLVEQVQGVPPVEEGTHSAVEEAVSTHGSETPSVEKEATVVSEETKVPSELAVASEEPVGTPEHPPTSDETDVVKQAEVVVDQETVLPQEAGVENPVVPIVEKTPGSSAVEEAVSNHEPETPSVEKAVLVEQGQDVPPVEEGTHDSVETFIESAVEEPVSAPVEENVSAPVKEPVSAPVKEVSAPVEEPVSAPVVEEQVRHEEMQAPAEENAQTKQVEIVAGLQDKVESPTSSTLEETVPASISDAALAEKEQAQTDVLAEEHVPTKTVVEAAVKEVGSVPTSQAGLAEHEETLPVVEHPATSDVNVTRPFVDVDDVSESARTRPQDTDVVEQAEEVVDQETVPPREADAENRAVPVVEKTLGTPAVEEAVLTHVPETPSVEKEAVLVEQVQGVPPAEEGTHNSVETNVEAAVEEPVSVPVVKEHEEIQVPAEESAQTKQAEIVAGLEDKVELPSSSTLEGGAPAPISDASLAEKEQVQTDALAEEPAPTQTVKAAVEEGDLVPTAETGVAKHEETLPVVEEDNVTTAKEQVELPNDVKSAHEYITTAAPEPTGIIPPVATSAAGEETSTEEPTREAVIAIPSVAEPAKITSPVATVATAEETSAEEPKVEAANAIPSVAGPTNVAPLVTTIAAAEETLAEERTVEAAIATPSVADVATVATAEEESVKEPTVEATIANPSVADPSNVTLPDTTVATAEETSTEEPTREAVIAIPSVAEPTKAISPVATVAIAEETSAEEPTVEAVIATPSIAEPTNVAPPVTTIPAEETLTEEPTEEAVIATPSVAEPTKVTPPVAAIATAGETSTEELTSTQEEVGAAIASITSVSEPMNITPPVTTLSAEGKTLTEEQTVEADTVIPSVEEPMNAIPPVTTIITAEKTLTEEPTVEAVIDAPSVAEPSNVTPPVATAVTAEEISTELTQEEVEAVIATVPSVAEPADVAEIETETANASKSVVGVYGETNNESKESLKESNALPVVEQHKSPSTPSSQVVSPDEQLTEPSTTEPVVDSSMEIKTEIVKTEELHAAEKLPAAVPATADVEEISKDVEQPLISTPQLVIDKSLLVEQGAEKSIEEPIQEHSVPVKADVEEVSKDVEQPPISTPQLAIDKPLLVEPAEIEEPPIPVIADAEKVSKDIEQPVVSTPQSLVVEPAELEKSSEVPMQEPLIPVTADVEEVLKDVEQPVISTPQLVIDQSLLVEPAEAEKSYEGPVQESPIPVAADVEEISKDVISTPQLVASKSLLVEPAGAEKSAEEPAREPLVPVTVDVEDIQKDVEQPLISTPQLVIDQSLLVEPAEAEKISEGPLQEPSTFLYSTHSQGSSHPYNVELETDAPEPSARPWTPSYSVHSQGSPLPTQAVLVQESTPQKEEPLVANEDEAVDSEIKFADKEAVPLGQQAQNPGVPAKAFSETWEAPVEVVSPCITVVETQHRLDATVASAQATFDSAHPEVSLTEAIAANLEQNSQVHVPQVEDVNNNLAAAAMPVTGIEVPRLVLDSSKDVVVPSVTVSEQVSEGQAPHVEERPASPWVPSYSVVVQGSPAQERPNPLDKEAIATTVPGAPKDVELELPVVETPTVLTNHVAEVESRDHETPSVEISKDEVVTKMAEEAPEASTVKAISVVSTSLVDDDQVEEVPIAATIALESLENPDNMNQELTKSPRADSQPNTTPEILAESNKLSPAPLDQDTNDSQQDTVSRNVSNDKKLDTVLTTATKPLSENMEVNPVREVFPTTEQSVAEQLNESKPSGLCLSTSDANTTTNGSSTSLDTISPATDRSRLESTSSSRFFPGGWFSPSKTVDESRPFFEVVQGEFTAQKVAAARDPSIDEGPSVAEQYTPTEGEANKGPQPTSKEQKSRWCVIM